MNFLSGPGKGVLLIKLGDDDRVLGAIASSGDRDLLTVETTRGAEQTISTGKYEVTGRGGKGRELLQRGQFTRVVWPTPEAPPPLIARTEESARLIAGCSTNDRWQPHHEVSRLEHCSSLAGTSSRCRSTRTSQSTLNARNSFWLIKIV